MTFNFYNELSNEQQNKYDLMLETNYILLRADELFFIETDEKEKDSLSATWLHSIQPSLDLFGLDHDAYPQGSISANRLYYEAIRNYLGRHFNIDQETNLLRQGLRNFLTLRCDNSATNSSYLFGSYFKLSQTLGSRDPHKYRNVDVNLRHSANALWILLEESGESISPPLEKSLLCFLTRIQDYLSGKEEWATDNFRHLTLASTINTCNTALKKSLSKKVSKLVTAIRTLCEKAIFSRECIIHNLYGGNEWRLPDANVSKMAKYEYYLNAFVLSQIPYLIEKKEIQLIIQDMINNKVESPYGYGIPIHRRINFKDQKDAMPDFGTTAAVLELLWYSISNGIGDSKWLSYCETTFMDLLDVCLNIYDKAEFYRLIHSENNAKILLMPRMNLDAERHKGISQLILKLKEAINIEMKNSKGKLPRLLDGIQMSDDLAHVKSIIKQWEISKYWKRQEKRAYFSKILNSETGEFLGSVAAGAIKTFSNP